MSSEYISVLLGGGFALAGTYLAPLIQRAHRREDRRSDHNALMRQQAERALILVGNLRSQASRGVKLFIKASRSENESREEFTELHELYAIIAVYFPSSLVVFTRWRDESGAELDKITAGKDNVPDPELTKAMTTVLVKLCHNLEKELSDEAQKYIGF